MIDNLTEATRRTTMDCNKPDCIHNKVCEEWKSLGNDNYINESNGNCDCYSAPYNPSGDLISRSDLKAELEVYRHDETRYVSDEEEAQNRLLDNILEDIDNAPTVEARPQGEWKTTVHGLRAYNVCNKCNTEYPFDLTQDWILCPVCGAEMKGGAE